MYDIIPDIHGKAQKLTGLLSKLGYRYRNGAWRHSDSTRSVVFLGDFIDRGKENAKVIGIVRAMIEAGSAQAIMGNHELNAIHFHTKGSQTGMPLRSHEKKNLEQHGSFLKEYPLGTQRAQEAITWMKSLPILLDLGQFQVIHACWNNTAIMQAELYLENARLTDASVEYSAQPDHMLYKALEILCKGPEIALPNGITFKDKGDCPRSEIRVAWWKPEAITWRDIAASVPEAERQLPDTPVPTLERPDAYPADAKPVFFGHYWLNGEVILQAPNALCLDYSAGKDGPLLAYSMEEGATDIDLSHITVFDSKQA